MKEGENEAPEREIDPIERALQLAFRYLDRRDRTVEEMRRHLRRKALDPEVVETAIGLLEEQGTLDDVRFARIFTEDKRMLEQWGSERIRSALLARGIDRDTLEPVLDEPAHESELERALALVRHRFPQPPRERHARDRALGVLVRKGYDLELALDALAIHARGPRSPDRA